MKNLIPSDYPDFSKHGAPLCAESYPDAFFPEESATHISSKNGKEFTRISSTYRYEKEARAICASCPYRVECAEYAINNPDLIGIWGGLSEKNRIDIRKARKLISVKIR